jgi:hypothetical protein
MAPIPRSALRRLERLLAPALAAGVTAWTVGRSAPPPAVPPVVPPAPVTVVAWTPPAPRLVGRCRGEPTARRPPPSVRGRPEPAPALPTAAAPVEEPTEEPTPAQPLPALVLTVAGEAISTAGLSAAQVRLLEAGARLPGLPTETVGGARYVRDGDRRYRDDCSNVLRMPYDTLGVDLFSEHVRLPGANGVRLIREKGAAVEDPRVGDLVIFDDTWDRDGNGAEDDPDTHAGIVVGFEPGGTVLVYNRVRKGHRVFRMNLQHPDVFVDPETGARWNDPLRRKRPGAPELRRSTGALFARYVRVLEG